MRCTLLIPIVLVEVEADGLRDLGTHHFLRVDRPVGATVERYGRHVLSLR